MSARRKSPAADLDMHLSMSMSRLTAARLLFYFNGRRRVDSVSWSRILASVPYPDRTGADRGPRSGPWFAAGICGLELCCCSYLNDFVPVSIKMAKMQNLSMNPTKISGMCGRLMCCLKYEQAAYEDATARMPKQGAIVMTSEGQGYIEHVNLLKETVTVRLDRGGEADLLTVPYEELSFNRGRVSRRYPSEMKRAGRAGRGTACAGESQRRPSERHAGTARRALHAKQDGKARKPGRSRSRTKAERQRPQKERSGRRGSGSRRRGRTGRPQGAEGAGDKPAQGSSD